MTSKKSVAVVVPCYNEQGSLPLLYQGLCAAVAGSDEAFTFVFVNDGSTDRSPELLDNLASLDPKVRVIHLARNFGHQAAIMAGMDAIDQADAAILMDADLQDSPEAIPGFLEKWRAGYDVVYAVRRKRKESFLTRAGFHLFYRMLNLVASRRMPLDSGIFGLIDQRVVQAIRAMPERNRYYVGLRCYAGFKQIGMEVERGRRVNGEPKVRTRGLIRLACDAIFSFSVLPLRIITISGLFVASASLLLSVLGAVLNVFFGITVHSWPFGLSTILFLAGTNFMFLGIIGEYVARIYDEVKRRPQYFVARRSGFEATDREFNR